MLAWKFRNRNFSETGSRFRMVQRKGRNIIGNYHRRFVYFSHRDEENRSREQLHRSFYVLALTERHKKKKGNFQGSTFPARPLVRSYKFAENDHAEDSRANCVVNQSLDDEYFNGTRCQSDTSGYERHAEFLFFAREVLAELLKNLRREVRMGLTRLHHQRVHTLVNFRDRCRQ